MAVTTTVAVAADAYDASAPQQKTGLWSSILTTFVTLGAAAACRRRKLVEDSFTSDDKYVEDDSASTTEGSDSYPNSADDASSGSEDCESSGEENCETETDNEVSEHSYPRQMLLKLRTKKPSALPAVCYSTRTIEEPAAVAEKAAAVSAPALPASVVSKEKDQEKPRDSWRADSRKAQSPASSQASSPTLSPKSLTPSATSWAARQQLRRQAAGQASQEELDDAEVVRKAKSILNKLTIEKFESLYGQLTTCGLKTAKHVEILVSEVFEKATTQHRFIGMYADLCARLDKHFSSTEGSCNFRRVLLDQCQASFEKSLLPPPELSSEGTSEEDRLEAQNKYKQRMLGNIRLVGELLVRKMLSPRILIACIEELISQPDRLESLAALLTTVGPTFDTPTWTHHALLEGALMRVSGLAKDPAVPSRARFLLRDVLDLRASGWVDKKLATKVEGPKKIDEVHREAAQEARVKEAPGPKAREAQKDRMPARPAVSSADATQGIKGMLNRRTKEEPKIAIPVPGMGAAASRSTTRLLDAVQALAEMEPAADKPAQPQRQRPAARAKKETPEESAAAKAKKADECSRSLAAIFSASAMVPTAPTKPESPAVAVSRVSKGAAAYDLAAFHAELSAAMRELSAAHKAPAAVGRIRGLRLPVAHQAAEFTNIITRGAEEANGQKRRAAFAFAAGLANGVFEKSACEEGLNAFCTDVYDDLKEEVRGLRTIILEELLPTLQGSLTEATTSKIQRTLKA